MDLLLERFSSGRESTLGLLFVNDQFECFTCEDQHQEAGKVYGETRIPAGVYDIKLRTVGGFHERYTQRFPDIHRGMLQIMDVPNFDYILFHVGNTDDDSAGCALVGAGAVAVPGGGGRLTSSVAAYKRFYPRVAGSLLNAENVVVRIVDRDRN